MRPHKSGRTSFNFNSIELSWPASRLRTFLWLQGYPDQAVSVAVANVDAAKKTEHTISLAHAIAQSACPVALYAGDLEAAEHYLELLFQRPVRHAMAPWDRWGRCLRGVLKLRQGEVSDGVAMLDTALAEFPENTFHMRRIMFLGELADGQGRAGDVSAGLTTIEQALPLCRRCEENWCAGELLRIKGELILKQAGSDAALLAEQCFREALDLGRQQNALAWELRAVTSLARLWRQQGRSDNARDLLHATYAQFTEGFATSDLKAAKALLDELL